jgi:hypothetical protein
MDLVKIKYALLVNTDTSKSTIAALQELDEVVVPGWSSSTPVVLTRLEVLMVGRNKLACLLTIDNVYVVPYSSYSVAIRGRIPSHQLEHCHYAEDITHNVILKNRYSNINTRDQILVELTGLKLNQVQRVSLSKSGRQMFDENGEKFTFQPIT